MLAVITYPSEHLPPVLAHVEIVHDHERNEEIRRMAGLGFHRDELALLYDLSLCEVTRIVTGH